MPSPYQRCISNVHSSPANRSYRQAKPLDATLAELCTTNIEERLYSQGFALLSAALTSGTNSSVPAQIPSPEHLGLAATLVVHPQFTSRTTSSDKHAAADDALRYLRDVNSIVGPCNAHLNEAFRFTAQSVSSRSKRAQSRLSEVLDPDDDVIDGRIHSSYASTASLWSNAYDFWSVIGWAFNCSVVHPTRWQRWKLLLDLLLNVLEDDFDARLPAAQEAFRSDGTDAAQASLKDALFTQYLSPIGEGRNNKRRVMRAIIANGSTKSLAEFGEIWKHETKPAKQKDDEPLAKRRKLDVENGEFADYLDDSDEESPGASIRRSRSATAVPGAQRSGAATDMEEGSVHDSGSGAMTPNNNNASQPPGVESFGGIEAIRLRQRVLALLIRYCSFNPAEFLDTEDLLDLYTEFIRPLPLAIFQHFALPTKPYLASASQASLTQMLLRPLLAATAPPTSEMLLTQDDFEAHYASHAANHTSAVDNAKVSLAVEGLLRILWNSKTLESSPKLRRLVGQGIAARREKVTFDGRKKVGARAKAEEEALIVLDCSAERMTMIIDDSI